MSKPSAEDRVLEALAASGRSCVAIHELARLAGMAPGTITHLSRQPGARIGLTNMNGVHRRSTRVKNPPSPPRRP